eukprot:1695082-Prymnesium_polylepis.1
MATARRVSVQRRHAAALGRGGGESASRSLSVASVRSRRLLRIEGLVASVQVKWVISQHQTSKKTAEMVWCPREVIESTLSLLAFPTQAGRESALRQYRRLIVPSTGLLGEAPRYHCDPFSSTTP